MSLVGSVAPACAWVAGQMQHVTLHADKIADYARFIVDKYPLITELDEHHFVSGDAETKAAYVLALDSINFGSGYFKIAQEHGVALEYHAISGGLKGWFEKGMFTRPEEWARVTAADFSRLLALPQGLDKDLDALLFAFQVHLNEAGRKITTEYGGKVMNLVAACNHSALQIAEAVAAWRGFHDVHDYKGRAVPILKRAQILAADLNLAIGGLSDIDKLTIFADNMVPHVLRCDGILDYMSDAVIAPGSEKEIEIRAAGIHAVELMKQTLGEALTSVNLDHMLWHRGYEPAIYAQKPHRTLSVWY